MTMVNPLPVKSSEYRAFNARLSHRITQAAVSVTLVLIFLIGTTAYVLVRSLIHENITHALEGKIELVAQRLELNLSAVARELSSLAATTVVSNALLDDAGRNVYLLPLLRTFKLPYDTDFTLLIADFEGKLVASRDGNNQKSYDNRPWVKEVIDKEMSYAEIVECDMESWLLMAYPILFPATGQAEGMLVLEFPLARILDEEPSLLGEDAEISMTCKHGSVANTPSDVMKGSLVLVSRHLNLPSPLHSLDLEVSVGRLRANVYAPLERLTLIFGMVAVLLVILVVFVARFMAQRITAPLALLSANAQNIALSGKPQGQVCIDGEDEVAALAHSFNNMLVRLQVAHEEFEQRVEERTHDLYEAQQAAERANNAKSEFLANMSHEFRTPMHAILSFSALATDKLGSAPPEKIRHYLERIHESGSRLLTLLNDLLDLSKLEAGKMEYCMAEHDLQHIVEGVKQELDGMLKNEGVRLNIQPPDGPVLALCDRDRIVQVVSNLLTNALKFTPHGKSITVGFEASQLAASNDSKTRPAIKVMVTDQGIGIPEDELPTIFDKFVQSSKTKTGAGGTGLGLAICKEIIEGHGGKIWASQNPEGGAVFCFVVPVGEAE
jgi:signal transduction histidine kinase